MIYQIQWSDESILVIDKPSGLRSIPDGYNRALPCLSNLLHEQFGRVWVVHRLDKDTSGVILFARNEEAHRALNQQFEQRKIKKEYRAIAIGMPVWETLTISLPLKVDGDRKHRTVIDHQAGKPAQTDVAVLHGLGVFALLAALPHTGYTHQIRTHLAAVAMPLLHDPLYKSLEPETQAQVQAKKIAAGLPIQRLALHAFQITFAHPANGEAMTVHASYPQDFQETVEKLQELSHP
jgi:tRNA pseudouridine32 synthase / 23S rRNA pseudouridine746 synthase